MVRRCSNEGDPAYKHYGARGIKVCSRWLGRNGLSNFADDMGPCPSKEYSLDRIDNDGGYEPSNCRWADKYTQQRNKREKHGSSGYTGVSYRKDKSKWQASIKIEGKTRHLGYFDSPQGAGQAFESAHLNLQITLNPL